MAHLGLLSRFGIMLSFYVETFLSFSFVFAAVVTVFPRRFTTSDVHVMVSNLCSPHLLIVVISFLLGYNLIYTLSLGYL